MDAQNLCRALMGFLDKCPNSFFTVKNISNTLLDAGFRRLGEGEAWELEADHGYFTTRNGSSLIAFRLPHEKPLGFQLMASHTDSPTFRVKPNPVLSVEDSLLRLNTERYGGMILSTWLDRPLSVAGRVLLRTAEGIESRLINIDRDLLVIPSLAIHMDRTVNDGYAFNAQRDM
ncbi:MAG: M18 family aminopeptidase, partial [Oscillospiraceae bacterium]|nr:M18 family aminopeptidase [Oscillospiraceae bacterium]